MLIFLAILDIGIMWIQRKFSQLKVEIAVEKTEQYTAEQFISFIKLSGING